jgi:hypothetical protein
VEIALDIEYGVGWVGAAKVGPVILGFDVAVKDGGAELQVRAHLLTADQGGRF